MLTINLASDQVQVTEVAQAAIPQRKMSVAEARHKLDDAKTRIEQAALIVAKDVWPRLDDAIAILLDIDDLKGWLELGYESMHQLIQREIKSQLNLSVSQIYRKFDAAKVRQGLSQVCENVDIPESQLRALGKLPSNEWIDALEEINSTAPKGRVTEKHVKKVVLRRQTQDEKTASDYVDSPDKQRLLQTGSKVEDLHDDDSSPCQNYEPRLTVMEPERHEQKEDTDSNFRALSSSAIEVRNIVTIQCGNNASPEQQQYSGCWGIVHQLYEQSAFISVGGELVEYPSANINLVQNPSPLLILMCDRIMSLWQVPNLPASVRHLLATFYQRRLDFSPEDLAFLAAIESFVIPSFTTNAVSEKGDNQTNTQKKLKQLVFTTRLPV